MYKSYYSLIIATAVAGSSHHADAGIIPLASTMDPGSYIAEGDPADPHNFDKNITGGFGRIGAGTGSAGDADAAYPIANINNPNLGSPLGSNIDLFPRETAFVVGHLTFNDSAITGTGVETTSITSIDLSQLWKSDPARVSGPSASFETDISDYALGLWFYNGEGGITFGDLDANDTVTFTNGLLTSIDLEVSLAFSASAFISELNWSDGTLSFDGNDISLQLDDTELFPSFINYPAMGESHLLIDMTGEVGAVGVYQVPEPASMLAISGFAALALRRRRVA